MDRPGRLFLCARCRDQVLVCSHCDRGQRYCSRAHSGMSRRERRREAAQRYQSSPDGQAKHAARTASWRHRRRSLRRDSPKSSIEKVTHQGCVDEVVGAPLLACDPPSASETTLVAESANDTVPALAGAAPSAVLVCRRCGHRLLPHVRQDFLRPKSVRRRNTHDHPT